MNTEPETTEEPIINKAMFPTALPAKSGMDTHMLTAEEAILPLPANTNDEVRLAMEKTCKEMAEKNFVDRRDPVELRAKLRQIQDGAINMRGQLTTIQGKSREAEKIVGELKKLQKHWAKRTNQFAEGSRANIQRRLEAVEGNLARLKRQERDAKRSIEANKQGEKDFLATRPRPGLQTNGELLSDFEEADRLEQEIQQMEYRASLRPGSPFLWLP